MDFSYKIILRNGALFVRNGALCVRDGALCVRKGALCVIYYYTVDCVIQV